MAAAVADYRPASVSPSKIKKDAVGDALTLELVKNPDILARAAAEATSEQLILGFAAETADTPDELVALGRQKLRRKGCDYLVLNRVGWHEGFATDGNDIAMLDRAGDIVIEAQGSKLSVANDILDVLADAVTTERRRNPSDLPGAP
jgi:phosphopantothenoylcysteine decarboxylase/phosphopantothenate--cysteine ligase